MGIMTFADESSYTGEYKAGFMHGYGLYKYADGSVY